MNTDTPVSPGRIAAVHLSIRTREPMRSVDEAMAVPGAGLLGCRHSRTSNERAVLLVESEVLRQFGLAPGQIKENITTDGIDLKSLQVGAQLQIGETAVLQVTGPCEPCRRMDEIRPGLKDELRGCRGVNTSVQVGGKIRSGDEVVILSSGRTLP